MLTVAAKIAEQEGIAEDGYRLIMLLTACAHAAYTNRSQLLLIGEGQEMALGLQSAQQVLKTEKLSHDPFYNERVERVGRRIAIAANKPEYKWEFHVVEKKDVNAFCLPGGKVFVYTGILGLTTSNDELAAVMRPMANITGNICTGMFSARRMMPE